MGIESHPFRGTVLTGSAAREFFRQVNNGYVSPAAKGSLIRGAAMSAELNATAAVRLRPRTERNQNMNGEPSGGLCENHTRAAGAGGRDRTDTFVRKQEFESCASTNSATPAFTSAGDFESPRFYGETMPYRDTNAETKPEQDVNGEPGKGGTCRHRHGDDVHHLGGWVCGECFRVLSDRPRTYHFVTPLTLNRRGTEGPSQRQEIKWQSEIRKSAEGTTLSTFLAAIARRFCHRDLTLSKEQGYRLALDAVKSLEVPFGHPDYDWSRASAVHMADEEMTYWDECFGGGNS